ncbi:MAG: hypothetical protein NZM35_09040 [Chitinophagales bacterium]|nr:hypothetical protein [Chitinophagales bacterium]MDW8418171.1 hypothetical protein [Chitinophagales bacterium]
MKNIFFLLALLVSLYALAQDGNNICVWNAMNNYNTGGGPSELERGIKCSDEAAVNPATSEKSKTWFYRGQLYSLVFRDTVLNKQYGNAAFEVAKSFKKLLELNDPKFRDWNEVANYLAPVTIGAFNAGYDQYMARNYAGAYKLFASVKDMNLVLKAKNQKTYVHDTTVLKSMAAAATEAGDYASATAAYKELITILPSPGVYASLVRLLNRQGIKEEALKVCEEGLAKYPKSQDLIIERLNFFLSEQKYAEGVTYLNSLLAIDPNNGEALFIKGLAYENEKMYNEDSAIAYYLKAIEVNKAKKADPAHAKPYNNIAAIYVKKSNAIVEQMNKLGTTAADQKKYEALDAEQKQWLQKALPYLEQAHKLNPDDAQIKRNYNNVKLKLGL